MDSMESAADLLDELSSDIERLQEDSIDEIIDTLREAIDA
jgi:hypothetical protein